jgi:hypothetical protein
MYSKCFSVTKIDNLSMEGRVCYAFRGSMYVMEGDCKLTAGYNFLRRVDRTYFDDMPTQSEPANEVS